MWPGLPSPILLSRARSKQTCPGILVCSLGRLMLRDYSGGFNRSFLFDSSHVENPFTNPMEG